jgi:hypothetical protein
MRKRSSKTVIHWNDITTDYGLHRGTWAITGKVLTVRYRGTQDVVTAPHPAATEEYVRLILDGLVAKVREWER